MGMKKRKRAGARLRALSLRSRAGKLVRNTSDKESRAWWKAVEDAAASAVDLDFEEDAEPERLPWVGGLWEWSEAKRNDPKYR